MEEIEITDESYLLKLSPEMPSNGSSYLHSRK